MSGSITAERVRQLHDETCSPMVECKRALMEAEGDVELAKPLLSMYGNAFNYRPSTLAVARHIIANRRKES